MNGYYLLNLTEQWWLVSITSSIVFTMFVVFLAKES